MKKIQVISALAVTMILMPGCSATQPSFDPSDTVVTVVDGKSYNIPKGATPSPYVDDKVIAFYQKIGLDECKQGDMTWEEAQAKEEMSSAIAKGDKGVYKKLATEGRIGCASPIATK